MIRVDVNVNDATAQIAGYGAGALLRLGRAPVLAGPYVELATQLLVAGVDAYTFWDANPIAGGWYRTQLSDALNQSPSAYSEPFLAEAVRAYANVEDLIEMLPRISGAGRDRNVLADCLQRGAAVLDARSHRDFYRHPQVTGEEVRVFDVPGSWSREGVTRIEVPEGVVSVSLVEYATATGGPFTAFGAGEVLLRPLYRGPGEPFWRLELSSAPGVVGRFWPGQGTVRARGVWGFEAVPGVMRAGNLALAREMVPAAIMSGGAPRGAWENPNGLLPTEAYIAVQWALQLGPSGSWFA